MKKIKHILVCGLAVVASAVAVQAQTLTQDWKMTTGLPSAAEGRAGVGFEGKVYTNFKANKSIVSFDGSKTETLLAGKSGSGVGISRDSKGNLIIGEFYQFNLSSCIRQQNSLTAQFVSFSLSNLANIFYPPPIFTIINLCLL